MPPGALGTGATRLDQNQSTGSWVSLCLSPVSHLHVFSTILIAPKSPSCVPLFLLSSPDSPEGLKVWGTKERLAGEGGYAPRVALVRRSLPLPHGGWRRPQQGPCEWVRGPRLASPRSDQR